MPSLTRCPALIPHRWDASPAAPSHPTRVSFQGISFNVSSRGEGSVRQLTIRTSAGSGSYGSVVGYTVNRGAASLTPIHLPDLSGRAAQGYQGHDSFAVIELRLARRFPTYKPGDTNAGRSGLAADAGAG